MYVEYTPHENTFLHYLRLVN